jgi:hypothetical protein
MADDTTLDWLFYCALVVLLAALLIQFALWQRLGHIEAQIAGIGAQVSEIAALMHQRGG